MSLNIGVLGAGFIGDIHLSCWEKIDGAEVKGVAEKSESRREMVSEGYGFGTYENPDALFEGEELDVVDVCLPTPMHKKIIEKAVHNVSAIICEKPIARRMNEANEMKEIARRNGVELYIGHVVRFFPEYVKMRNRITEGEVGHPGVIRTFRGGASPFGRAKWYKEVDKSGRILVDMLIHDFDWLRWTVGEVQSVYTKGLSFEKKEKDMALVNLRFKNGSIAHVEGSWAHPEDYPFTTKVEVAGSDGLLTFDSNNSVPLEVYKYEGEGGSGTGAPESPLSRNPWCKQLDHFLESFRLGRQPRVTVEDSIEALKISLSALKSLESGEPVKVGDISG